MKKLHIFLLVLLLGAFLFVWSAPMRRMMAEEKWIQEVIHTEFPGATRYDMGSWLYLVKDPEENVIAAVDKIGDQWKIFKLTETKTLDHP